MNDTIRHILQGLRSRAHTVLSGLQGSSGTYVLAELVRRMDGPWMVIVRDESRAQTLVRDLLFYLGNSREVSLFPSWEVLPFERTSPYIRLQAQRLEVLQRWTMGNPPDVTVIPVGAWMMRLPPRQWILGTRLSLATGMEVPMEAVLEFLDGAGYRRVPLVEELGDYSVRGGILDCFPPGADLPLRMEFFDDQVISIRSFSPETQRSEDRLSEVFLSPVREIPWTRNAREALLRKVHSRLRSRALPEATDLLENLAEGIPFPGMEFLLPLCHESLETWPDTLAEEAHLVLEDPEKLSSVAAQLWDHCKEKAGDGCWLLSQILSPEELYLPPEELEAGWRSRKGLILSPLTDTEMALQGLRLEITAFSHADLKGSWGQTPWREDPMGAISRTFHHWLHEEGLEVHWVVRTQGQALRLSEHLKEAGLPCRLLQGGTPEGLSGPRLWIRVGDLSEGFRSPELGVVYLTEEEVFGPRRLRRPPRARHGLPSVTHLEELEEGDLVVHVDHGIGIYRGLRNLEMGGIRGDFVLLEYLGGDRLYLPVSRLQLLHKYLGTEGFLPKIDRLGSPNWERRKKRARRAVRRMARELLQLYAHREVSPGYAFSPPDELFHQFEEAFPYEETPDQRRAIEEVMADMGLPRPMDRLVCGDVGFGKTEVAMRAAFRAVMDGKQVAYLVPTTILAEQHYQTFCERFRGFPVWIEVISRFRSPTQQRKILERCADGRVDILIGTHRLLQRDVSFKDLGLLIIDEEHRFGVAQKERLKALRKEVDVLTLTATPIPRTLHMAMLGIRDLSVIETPPPERLSIQTFVVRFDRNLIQEAVHRELSRGGQVFFVYNRVRGIGRMAQRLRSWLPGVRIGIAHGQLPSSELADVMERFHRKEIDLLVCTTIIQSGLDIPAANTILIHHAHHLGLAEMYQIRGRVGRSGHQAFCYLLLPEGEARLGREALKRIEALREFSELGSGFRVATRDLEIRGAGTLLGPSQSGHIDAVGFELYTHLMRRAIAEIRGEEIVEPVEPEIHLPVDAYLPEEYVPDPHQRLALYRRLSRLEEETEIAPLREELQDRFGPLPEEANNLLHLMGFRCLLKGLRIREARLQNGRLVLRFLPDTPLSPQGLVCLAKSGKGPSLHFLSEDTLCLPLDGGPEPLPQSAVKALKALLQGASMRPERGSDGRWA